MGRSFRFASRRSILMSFTRNVTVRFDEADPRGILFYGRLQELAHRVFEEFAAAELVDRWEAWFMDEDFIVPIRHAESDFHRPMRPGRVYEARLAISRLGESSFEVWTRFYDRGENPAEAGSHGPEMNPAKAGSHVHDVLCAETRVAHVFADPKRFRKIPIPSALRVRLEAHLSGE